MKKKISPKREPKWIYSEMAQDRKVYMVQVQYKEAYLAERDRGKPTPSESFDYGWTSVFHWDEPKALDLFELLQAIRGVQGPNEHPTLLTYAEAMCLAWVAIASDHHRRIDVRIIHGEISTTETVTMQPESKAELVGTDLANY